MIGSTNTGIDQIWALTWQNFLRARFPILICVVLGLGLPWVIFKGILQVPMTHFKSVNFYPAFFGMVLVMSLIFAYEAQQGVRQFLAARPVSNRFIFLWLMFVPAITVIIVHTLANGVVHVLYGVDWPWIRPVLWMPSIAVLLKCFYWRLLAGWQSQVFLFLGICILFLLGWAKTHELGANLTVNNPITWTEILVLAMSVGIALIVGYQTLCALRAGVRYDCQVDLEAHVLEVAAGSLRGRTRAFTSTSDALGWITWRQIAPASICGVLMGLVMCWVEFR